MKVLDDKPVAGNPGTLKPFVQSLVVVALSVVVFGAQIKLLFADWKATPSEVPKIPCPAPAVKSAAGPLPG